LTLAELGRFLLSELRGPLMRMTAGLTAALAAWATAGAAAAQAQGAAPDPYQCAVAYAAAGEESGRFRLAGVKGERTGSLGEFLDNFADPQEYDRRVDALEPRFKAPSSGRNALAAQLESLPVAKQMATEGAFASSDATLAPDRVYRTQREIFARVRACDLAYGFKPVLGAAPSHDEVVARYRAQRDKAVDQDRARLAALDDRQCVVRFMLLGSAMPGNTQFQQAMAQRIDMAARKAIAAQPGLTPETLLQQVQRDAAERAPKLKSKEDGAQLLGEVNTCERRYQAPLTTLSPPAG